MNTWLTVSSNSGGKDIIFKERSCSLDCSYDLPTHTATCSSSSSSCRNCYCVNWFNTSLVGFHFHSIGIFTENWKCNVFFQLVNANCYHWIEPTKSFLLVCGKYWSLVMASASAFQQKIWTPFHWKSWHQELKPPCTWATCLMKHEYSGVVYVLPVGFAGS